LAIRFGLILRKVGGNNRTWAGAWAQSVLLSVWRTCWQQGRSAMDFLSQLLQSPPHDCALSRFSATGARLAVLTCCRTGQDHE
jgi:hypothetical protein